MLSSSDPASAKTWVAFHIDMERCTSTLARVIGLFAQRDLVITRMTLMENGGGHRLTLSLPKTPPHVIDTLSAKIENVIGVWATRSFTVHPHEVSGTIEDG